MIPEDDTNLFKSHEMTLKNGKQGLGPPGHGPFLSLCKAQIQIIITLQKIQELAYKTSRYFACTTKTEKLQILVAQDAKTTKMVFELGALLLKLNKKGHMHQ